MPVLFLSLLFFLLFVLQVAVFSRFSLYGAAPDLLQIASIFFALYFLDRRILAIFVFLSGFLLDMYSGAPGGAVLISFIINISVIYFLAHNFFHQGNFLIFCFIVALGSILHYLIYFIVLDFYGASGGFLAFKTLMASMFLNVVFAILLYVPFKKFLNFIETFKK